MTYSTLVLEVKIHELNGLFYACCSDLPGLHVSADSVEQVCDSVSRSIKAIFKHSRKMNVEVVPATSNLDDFPAAAHLCDRFVVQQRLAA